MPQLGRTRERENLGEGGESQKSVREVRESKIWPDREFLAFVTLGIGKIASCWYH